MRRHWDDDQPAAGGLALQLYLAGVFLISLQLDIEQFKDLAQTRLPPGDIALALSVLVAPRTLRFRSDPISMLPLAMMGTLGLGLVVGLLYRGEVTSHALLVKFVGAAVVAIWCLVTVTHVRAGHGVRILRVWLVGMAFWGVVAYVDWKIVDFIPFLEENTPSRFAGMPADPNNAGAAYAAALVIMLWFGHRVFDSRTVRNVVTIVFVVALFLTLSRGGYVAFGASVAVVLVVSRVGVRRWARFALAIVLVLAAGLVTGAVDEAIDDFQNRPDTVGSRGTLVEDAMDSYADSRGLGIGLGTFRVANDQIVHNTALWLLVEMSFVGLALFVAMAAVPARATLRVARFDRDLARALLGAHVVYVVASFGIEALYQRHWWLIVGLCAWPLPRSDTASKVHAVPGTATGASTAW